MLISLYQMASEVAGITGKDTQAVYGKVFGISRDPKDENKLIMTTPPGVKYINDGVRAGIMHEAMHGKYTDFYDKDGMRDIMRASGIKKPEQQEILFEFLNAFEDVRIEGKAIDEYFGCNRIFQEGFDHEFYNIMSAWDTAFKANPSADKIKLMYARFWLSANIVFLRGYRGYTHGQRRQRKQNFWMDSDIKFEEFCTYVDNNGDTRFWWETKDQMGFRQKTNHALSKHFKEHELNQVFYAVSEALTNTSSTAEGFQLATKIYLEQFLSYLPDNLKEELDKEKMESAMENLIDAIKNGKIKMGSGEDGPKQNASSPVGRLQQGSKKDDESYDSPDGYGGRGWDDKFRPSKNFSQRLPTVNEKANEIVLGLVPILQEIKEYQETGGESLFLKKGRLDNTRLYRASLGEETVYKRNDAPDYNDDVAMSIVIDISGSMVNGNDNGKIILEYDKHDVVTKEGTERLCAALAVGKGINNALSRIDRHASVISFSNEAIKNVENGGVMNDKETLEILNEPHEGTNIEEGYKKGASELIEETRKSKILFFITDGEIYENHLDLINADSIKHGITPYFLVIDSERKEEMIDNLKDKMKGRYFFGFFKEDDMEGMLQEVSSFVQKLLTNKL